MFIERWEGVSCNTEMNDCDVVFPTSKTLTWVLPSGCRIIFANIIESMIILASVLSYVAPLLKNCFSTMPCQIILHMKLHSKSRIFCSWGVSLARTQTKTRKLQKRGSTSGKLNLQQIPTYLYVCRSPAFTQGDKFFNHLWYIHSIKNPSKGITQQYHTLLRYD